MGFISTEVGLAIMVADFIAVTNILLGLTLSKMNHIEDEKSVLITERQRLYELPNHLLCVLDENARFKSVNKGFVTLLKYEEDELIVKPIWDFIHPDDIGKSVETELKGRMTVIRAFENRYRDRFGKYHWLRWSGTIIDNHNYGAVIDGIRLTFKATVEAKIEHNKVISFKYIAEDGKKSCVVDLAQYPQKKIGNTTNVTLQHPNGKTFVAIYPNNKSPDRKNPSVSFGVSNFHEVCPQMNQKLFMQIEADPKTRTCR